MPEYLTEANLGLILNELFPNNDFIHDKAVPDSTNKRLRPDYRSDEMKIILEFDGDSQVCLLKYLYTLNHISLHLVVYYLNKNHKIQ